MCWDRMASVLVACSSEYLLACRTSELGWSSGFTQIRAFCFSPQPCKFNITKGRNHWSRTVTRFQVLPCGPEASFNPTILHKNGHRIATCALRPQGGTGAVRVPVLPTIDAGGGARWDPIEHAFLCSRC